jgi:hypothetical protein
MQAVEFHAVERHDRMMWKSAPDRDRLRLEASRRSPKVFSLRPELPIGGHR